MYISLTSSHVNGKDAAELEKFLADFLPRVKELSGVEAIYHYARPGKSDECTVIIWRDEGSYKSYSDGGLVMEAVSFEVNHGIKSTREAYETIFAL